MWDRATGARRASRRSCGRTGGPTTRAPRCGEHEALRPRAHRARARRDVPGDEAALGARPASARDASGLAYGDVASWLLHRLGGVHVCDAGNAARSLLCPLGGADWDDELLDALRRSRARCCRRSPTPTRIEATIAGVPVRAAVGDQQASLFGLRCWEPGAAKVTLGTGAFVLAHAGEAAPATAGRRARLGRVAARAGRRATRSRASSRPRARRSTGSPASARCPPAAQLDALLREAGDDAASSACPRSRASARRAGTRAPAARCSASSLGTTRADLARAVVDGVLHQVADALDAIGALDELWVDGGLVALGLDRPAARRPRRRPRPRTARAGLDRARRRDARGPRGGGLGAAGGAARDPARPLRRAGDGRGGARHASASAGPPRASSPAGADPAIYRFLIPRSGWSGGR